MEDVVGVVIEEEMLAAVLSLCGAGSRITPSLTSPQSPSTTSPEKQLERGAEVLLLMLLTMLSELLEKLLGLAGCVRCGVAGGVMMTKAAGGWLEEGSVSAKGV